MGVFCVNWTLFRCLLRTFCSIESLHLYTFSLCKDSKNRLATLYACSTHYPGQNGGKLQTIISANVSLKSVVWHVDDHRFRKWFRTRGGGGLCVILVSCAIYIVTMDNICSMSDHCTPQHALIGGPSIYYPFFVSPHIKIYVIGHEVLCINLGKSLNICIAVH